MQNGLWSLASLDIASKTLRPTDTPYNTISYVRVRDGKVAFVGGAADRPTAVVLLDLATGKMEEVRRASELRIDPGYISAPEPVEFPTENGLTAFGLFYPPRNQDFAGPSGALAAADGDCPRRADRGDRRCVPPGHPVLH